MNFTTVDLGQLDCWPMAGFAPGDYYGRCVHCIQEFVGAKHSTACLSCAVKVKNRQTEEIVKMKQEVTAARANPPERIEAAAIFHGATISLPPPARHHTILNFMATVMGLDATEVHPVNQGFLTNKGRFVNRTEGYYIAYRAGQFLKPDEMARKEPTLYSEDVW
ncbi:hypothetical protein [Paracoccus litorisediminis]|uniref:Uncharacterized protein n=1 Tax=Paracoccus litorisediminis TaxID=2006130 RepID=A0A844HMJ2_9RHOB|nr:hypothetical protein [Paracoccus litorisediminis]MTH61086.1 hypothetical protein [Paracoccus litorisediminis]